MDANEHEEIFQKSSPQIAPMSQNNLEDFLRKSA